MSKTQIETKEPQMSVLTPLEQDCLKEVVSGERYTGRNTAEIKTQLFAQLLEHEKQSIYEISEIDESLREVRGNLDDLDEEFKQLENIIETQTNEYLGIINDMSNFETQSKIVNTRINNYERLKETLQMLIGETYFTEEEIESLTEPDFENPKKIEASLATLTKIGKYIRNSNRFTANKYIVSKNQEFTRHVDIFEAKLKEYIKKLAKKAIKYYSDKGSLEDTQLVDTSYFRKSTNSLRLIFHQMFIIHDYDDKYFKSLVNDIGSQISEFTTSMLGNFEKKWKSSLSTFNIFNKKWNITSQMEINKENLNENKDKMKLTSFFEQVIGNFDEQMESDENFWTLFFSFDDKRLTKESSEIKYFLTLIYTLPKQKLVELLNMSKKISSISTFFMLAEVKKILQNKQKEDDQPVSLKGKDDMSYSYATMFEIFKELNNHNNMFAQEQIKYLDEYKVDKGTVLLPVRNYTSLATTLYEIFAKTNKDIFILNIAEIYTAIKAWLYKIAQTQPQHKDALIIHNAYHIYSNFSKINDKRYVEISNEMKDIFDRHSKAYAKSVFGRTFTRFSEYWFKLKEISEQNDISAVQLSGSYSKTSFLKLSKATFSSISLAIESMIKRISEEFKDSALLKLEYDRLTEYLLKEYEEIEKFAAKAYSERVNPTKAEIQAVLIDKRP